MGRLALKFEEDEKARDKREQGLFGKLASMARVVATTTLLAYLIVLVWMRITGDTTLLRLVGVA